MGMPTKFTFILASAVMLLGNVFFVFNSVPPDGRWIVQLPVTTLFVGIYLVFLYFLTKKVQLSKNVQSILIYMQLLLVFLFFSFGWKIRMFFQDIPSAYVYDFIPVFPYVLILSFGLIAYVLIALMATKRKRNHV